ncbi:HTH-type transcriptional regulator YofA [Hartmannibacter diazotrophicus]|uniref:HTH-type transcriptional regulator YofA n=1 Tax=Hartmannibacter diazotrophicus TaxID=1482074 RepID=A0A2C9D823_9HYPH|nr:LysR substrate-binding domain-containing protein [Hartmannibacter diazotrophicus]SON56472.1 HTH-type transcriptional regulator YofA [Hartmannibacter diazotrophicus]
MLLSLDPDFLRSFLAISETGSYGAAAERVNKTQSTVSAQMKRLEEVLNVSLFEKNGRRNTLTPSGLRLLEFARQMVHLNDETLRAFHPPDVSGFIRIGTSDDYAQAFLIPVLSRFAATHPAVEVEVLTDDTSGLLKRRDRNSFDAMLIATSRGGGDVETLRTDKLHWIGSDQYSRHQEEKMPLVMWSEGCAWRSKAEAALSAAGRPWRVAFTTSNSPLLFAAVRDGLGITIGPRWYLKPGLRVLDDLDALYPLGSEGLGIMARPGNRSAPLEAFLTEVRAQFRGDTALMAAA